MEHTYRINANDAAGNLINTIEKTATRSGIHENVDLMRELLPELTFTITQII